MLICSGRRRVVKYRAIFTDSSDPARAALVDDSGGEESSVQDLTNSIDADSPLEEGYSEESALFRRYRGKSEILQRVLDKKEDQQRALDGVHTEIGHKGREATYALLKHRYWWPRCHEDLSQFVRSCQTCQAREPRRIHEPAVVTSHLRLFDKWHVDTTPMPEESGDRYVIQGREAVSGWIEARVLQSATGAKVKQFIEEDIICRHGTPREIVLDAGPENRGEVSKFLEKEGIARVKISTYHPGSNGPVERAMRTLKDALSKMTGGYPEDPRSKTPKNPWRPHFHAALLADRVTVNASTGISPYTFLYGVSPVIPIELEIPTWSTLPWHEVQDRSDLIAMRARQLERREKDVEEAMHYMQRVKESNADYFDETHTVRNEPLQRDDYVLLHDSIRKEDLTSKQKLRFRWLGPYQVERAKRGGSYNLRELDGTVLYGLNGEPESFNGDRLKRFFFRTEGAPSTTEPLPQRRAIGRSRNRPAASNAS
ncbi:hypothetical protein N7461_005772 [Penicillium sp. DV-2018c]|nr:hypothetical protein N7461_005772 [Penicillium sp. DV-2018c]